MQNTSDDLYLQKQEIIDEYEDKAFWKLTDEQRMDCCLGDHPSKTRFAKLFEKTARELYILDKSK